MSSKSIDTEYCCKYVVAKSGLNVRESAGLNSKVIDKIPYGTIVRIELIHQSDEIHELKVGDEIIKGKWLQVDYEDKEKTGYVFDYYLAKHLKEIPKHTLYWYQHLALPNFIIYKSPEQNDYYENNYGMPSCKCFPFYEENWNAPTVTRGEKEVTLYDDESFLDTMKHYLKIEPVNIDLYKNKKAPNPYEIDTTYKPNNVSTNPDANDFYLHINDGKDSVRIKDYHGEFYMSHVYSGELKALDKYLVTEYFEYPSVYTVDKKTGEKAPFSNEAPHISPDGKYVVSLYEEFSYEEESTCAFQVFKLNDPEDFLTVRFKTWLLAETLDQAFWISNNEIVLKVIPIDNIADNPNRASEVINYEYLKMTFLK